MELDRIIEFKFRIWPWNKAKTRFQVLWYIDARNIMDFLDKEVWIGNWQRDHKEVAWKVYWWLWIKIDNQWIRKWDCWTESNIDKEKWESSDSFKRACVNWGIGRYLYTLPNLAITKEEADNNKYNITKFVKTKYKKELWEWYKNIKPDLSND